MSITDVVAAAGIVVGFVGVVLTVCVAAIVLGRRGRQP